MKPNERKKLKHFLYFLCIVTLLATIYLFFASSPFEGDKEDTWANFGRLAMGSHLTIQNTDNRLTLLHDKDLLSAEGLYYADWAMGDCEAYENSDGDTIDLYDAQLYCILGEYKNSQEARKNMDLWLDAEKGNYEVLSEEEISCNGQSYHLITYACVNENNPYDRGVSAFGVYGDCAMCMELTCRKNFQEDLRAILIHFLDNCTYSGK